MTGTGTARTVALGVGGTLLVAVVLTYRLPYRSTRERVRYLLDLATVIIAATSFGLYWTASGGFGLTRNLVGVAAGPVVAVFAGFAVGRLYISGAAPFRWHVGLLCPAAAAVEAVARALGPEFVRSGRVDVIFVLSLWSHALLLCAAWLQHHRALHSPSVRQRARRRPYSMLPYVSLTTTYALLVGTLVVRGLDARAWMALTAAVASTLIVVARQLSAFEDNAQLLAERNALAERLHALAFTDSLTGLGNRAQFLEELDRALREPGATGVLLIDLDDFKPVNDRHGHAAGDSVLRTTATRLQHILGPDGVAARLGGDEFAALVRQPVTARLPELCDEIMQALAAPCRIGEGDPVAVGASVGYAVSTGPTVDQAELLRRADQAMYRAKADHKRSVQHV